MITERDLQEAIAECQGVRDPNANTCMKLAAYYTIQDHLYKKDDTPRDVPPYSYAAAPLASYASDSEFSQVAKEKDPEQILALMDELMDTLKLINPRLYEGVMAKLLS